MSRWRRATNRENPPRAADHRADHVDRDEALRLLGLPASASSAEILGARRELAKVLHPDVGGSTEAMGRLNRAVEVALGAAPDVAPPPPGRTRSAPTSTERSRRRYGPSVPQSDHPSFAIEALPATAFEGLLLAVAALGQVAEEEPPYLLVAHLDAPLSCWCELQLVPDAGATAVSIAAGYRADIDAGRPAPPVAGIEVVRDAIIAELNELDWSVIETS